MTTSDLGETTQTAPAAPRAPRRHALATRLWHWVTAAAVLVLLGSGLAIFNAHPRLYWGSTGNQHEPAWLQIGSTDDAGYLRVGALEVGTTGVLGLWHTAEGRPRRTAFPPAVTLPGPRALADARDLHLAAAWILLLGWPLFMLASVLNRHLARDLLPRPSELRPGHVLRACGDHLRLRLHDGGGIYNILQKLTYLGVIVGLGPVIVLTGLAMSPAMAAALPWLLDLFGGRQSARTVHFIAAGLFALFVLVHLVMLVLYNPWRLTRDMILGGRRADRSAGP